MSINRARIGRVLGLEPSLFEASVMGEFVADAFINKTLSAEGVTALIEFVKEYYEVEELTPHNLLRMLSEQKYFSLPEQTQAVLGHAFLHHIKKNRQAKLATAHRSHELSIEIFEPIARSLQFSVKYYTEAKVEQEDEAVIGLHPMKHINSNAKPTLEVIATNSNNLLVATSSSAKEFHFDRIMPSEAAAQLRTRVSASCYSLHNEGRIGILESDPAAMKKQVQQVLKHIHGPITAKPKAKPAVHEVKTESPVAPAVQPTVGPYGTFARVMQMTKPAPILITPASSPKSTPILQKVSIAKAKAQEIKPVIQETKTCGRRNKNCSSGWPNLEKPC